MTEDPTNEVTDLLQRLIRNACVNDGSQASGGETRSAELLETYLAGAGLGVERYESSPGRGSLVARIEGSDPTAPSLLLMGHTDVVPVNAEAWTRDPFGGELTDGIVWGRGAIDMLNLTASMAVAARRLARAGFAPRGTLAFAAVADEEALGTYGAEYLLNERPEAVAAEYVITEAGGYRMPLPSASAVRPVIVGEKGAYWSTLRVHGTPGHASMPLRTDNALVKAARIVAALADHRPAAVIDETWRRFVEGAGLPAGVAAVLLDPARIGEYCEELDDVGLAREIHAGTHTTIAPTIAHGGVKTNVIPDTVDIQVDVRTLPGQTGADVREIFRRAIGDELMASVEVLTEADDAPSASPVETPLWETLRRVTGALAPGSSVVPLLSTGATDARFFRRKGVTSYGYGLYSERISFAEFTAMFHGNDERVDQETLRLSVELWEAVAGDLLG